MSSNPFENQTTVDFAFYEAPVEPSSRQQDKIIARFERPDYSFSQGDVIVSGDERQDFLQKLAEHRISEGTVDEFINSVNSRFITHVSRGRGPVEIFTELESYPNFRQIQGIMLAALKPELVSSGNYNGWVEKRKGMDHSSLLEIAGMKYSNPRDLEATVKPFMDAMREDYGSEKFAEYEKSLRVFEHLVFGKQYEYSEQMKILEQEAVFKSWASSDREAPKKSDEKVGNTIKSLQPEGSIKRVIPSGDDFKSLHQAEADDLKRLGPVREMLTNQHKVGYEIFTNDSIDLFSVPENPSISDGECVVVISALAKKIVETSKNSGESLDANGLMKKLLLITGVDSRNAVPNIVSEGIFSTRNSIYRNVVSRRGDIKFFESLF